MYKGINTLRGKAVRKVKNTIFKAQAQTSQNDEGHLKNKQREKKF